MPSAVATIPTSSFATGPLGSRSAWTGCPTVGNSFSFFTKRCSNASVCAFLLQPLRGSCLPKSTQPLPSYTPTAGHSSRPSRFCAGTWASYPQWTSSSTSLRWRNKGKASGWAFLESLVGYSSPFSRTHTRDGRANSSGCVQTNTTPQPWMAFPCIGWKSPSWSSPNLWTNYPLLIKRYAWP